MGRDYTAGFSVQQAFQAASSLSFSSKQEALPFSIRLTADEKAYLQQKAGNKALGVYIRACLLGEQAAPRRTLRKPKTDEKQVAALLAGLGESRIASNLNQLAKHANMGTLGTPYEIERQLEDACAAVIAMREALFIALGLRSGAE